MVSSAKAGVKTARQSSATGRRALRRDVVHLYSARDNVNEAQASPQAPAPLPPPVAVKWGRDSTACFGQHAPRVDEYRVN